MRNVLFILAGFITLTANAQVEIKAKSSKDAVLIGEPFILEFKVNSTFDHFVLPEFENFKVISGPNTSMQQNINMVNGDMIRKTSVKYTYIIKALNPGTQTISAAEIKIEDKFYYSNTVDIIVIDSEYSDPNKHKGKDIEGTQKL